jgi:hypothetical protein
MQQNKLYQVYHHVRSGYGNDRDKPEDSFSNIRHKETKIMSYSEKASKSDLYARVKLAPVNAIQRAVAVNALRDAEAISNALVWALSAVRRLFSRAGHGANNLLHNH